MEAYLNRSSTPEIWSNISREIPANNDRSFVSRFESRLKGPTCSNVTIRVEFDDQYSAIIDGVIPNDTNGRPINNSGEEGSSSNSFEFESFYNNYFTVNISNSNVGGSECHLYFNWTYGNNTCNGESVSAYEGPIPEENYCSEPIVLLPSGIPHNITVSCPAGFEMNSQESECIEVSGNSFRTSSEECDNGGNAG